MSDECKCVHHSAARLARAIADRKDVSAGAFDPVVTALFREYTLSVAQGDEAAAQELRLVDEHLAALRSLVLTMLVSLSIGESSLTRQFLDHALPVLRNIKTALEALPTVARVLETEGWIRDAEHGKKGAP